MDLSSTTLLSSVTMLLISFLTSFLYFATDPSSMVLCEGCGSRLSIIFVELLGWIFDVCWTEGLRRCNLVWALFWGSIFCFGLFPVIGPQSVVKFSVVWQ